MACDTLRGLQFIHSAGFVHRDLKSPNLLVDKNWNIKIADFGLSCAKGEASGGEQVSLLWTAPEILQQLDNCYSDKSDVYSFAIILWELMAQKLPFDGLPPPAIHASVVHGKRPLIDGNWPISVQKAISTAWEKLPSQRSPISTLRGLLETIPIDESEVPTVGNAVIRSTSALRSEYCPRGQLILAFLHIPNEYDLWTQAPQAMYQAICIYKDLVRAHIKNQRGIELPLENDDFMIAFADISTAVNFCMRLQYDLISCDWPADLSSVSYASDESEKMLEGLRIAMCIHYGTPNLQGENVSKMECSGEMVDEGNCVVQCAAGGQILITTEAKNQLISGTNFDTHILESFSSITIPSRKDPLFVYEIASKELTCRLGMRSTYFNSLTNGVMQTNESSPVPSWIISYEDLSLGNLIGNGVSGDVHQANFQRKQVAVKKFTKQKYSDKTLLELKAEAAKLSVLAHQNIVKFYGVCLKPSFVSLVYECVPGNLATLLRTNTSIPWDKRLQFAKDIATGLEFLHMHNIIHRDLKSTKLLVGGDFKIKIGGFGFANMKAENHTMTQVGTVAWTSPEIFNAEPITEKSDIFSYAVILWEIIFCTTPWEGMHTMKVINQVTSGMRLPGIPPASTPQSIVEVMRESWAQEPKDRPSASDILLRL